MTSSSLNQGIPGPSSSGASTPTEARPRPRVLAVDDQRDSLRLLEIRLRAAGIDCFPCSSGPAALALLEHQPVDVVILDVMMPEMDGFEVCRRIKANPDNRDIPVLFLTAKLETEDKVRGLEVGGHDYLSKPVDHQELLARTRAALRVKYLQDQLKEQLQLQQKINVLQQEMLGGHWEKTLGQLAASLAHEVNNPLAAALGSVQLLALDRQLSPVTHQRLAVIDGSLQRVGRKLRSLLLIAQSSRQPQTICLAEMVEDLLALINYQVLMCKVRIVTELNRDCYWEGDPGELARAVLYILNNAMEAATGGGDPLITVRIQPRGNSAGIHILDRGCGVSEEIRDRIFDPFFTTKGPPHHGVGLYLASQIVKAAGGQIHFRDLPGPDRTEFEISLPAISGA